MTICHNCGRDDVDTAICETCGERTGLYAIVEAAKSEERRKVFAEVRMLADERRREFCLAAPGTDEEFRAWLDGFDAAVSIIVETEKIDG